ncbi:hypothetical protein Pla111_24370 [Botrimarina hoheduenensis]|uniref:Uncharacterized protein n=1 Tax=Botrimarina hoheduenensis TaxID=2528000 RepID=A0A5C5VXY9_9BACT|nr:hypothetical protein Pla111_24370 [Botrimarina hoheduenensis]
MNTEGFYLVHAIYLIASHNIFSLMLIITSFGCECLFEPVPLVNI